MKKIAVILSIALIISLFAGCEKSVQKNNSSLLNPLAENQTTVLSKKKDNSADMLYNNFISGKTTALDKQGNPLKIQDLLNGNSAEYAFYDMNGDGISELLIKSTKNLTIFWIVNYFVTLWHETTNYTKPLNNGALLSKRLGGAPEHTDYSYSILGYNGSEIYKLYFSEYPASSFEGLKISNKYFINDNEVTKTIYDSLTSELLNLSDDKIVWKSIN